MYHFPELPPILNTLLTENNHNSVKFRKKISKFKSGIAMESHKVDAKTVLTGVPGTYTIKGMVYRKLGPMTAMLMRPPRYL